jgi:tetratricopeptide (TPR) repeat protein
VLHANRGYLALKRSDAEGAIAECKRAVALKADEFTAHVNLAKAYAWRKDMALAIAEMDTAIRLQPERVELYRTRAEFHIQREQWRPALHDLDDALRLAQAASNPAAPEAKKLAQDMAHDHRARGQILARLGLYPQALLAGRAALELDTTDASAHRLCGQILLQLECWEDALAALDGVPRSLRDTDYYRERARARGRLRDFMGSVMECSRALEIRPEAQTYIVQGWSYLEGEVPKLALQSFQEALGIDPQRGEASLGLAQARVRLGDYRLAVHDAQQGLKSGPPSWRLSYQGAVVFARAASLSIQAEERGRYEAQAVAHLASALEQLPRAEAVRFFSRTVLSDPCWGPLKNGHRAFGQLAREFASPSR